MHAIAWHPRGFAAAVVVAIAILSRSAVAQSVEVKADATVNVGYNQTTRSTVEVDPDADKADVPSSSTSSLFTEIRPAITLQSGSPRLTWRAGYLFSGNVSLAGGSPTFSNQANGALVAEMSQVTVLTMSAAVAQGGTSFQLSQRAASEGTPEIRAPGNPNTITASLSEAIAWQASRHLQVQHSLLATVSALQDDLGNETSAFTGTLSLERPFDRDVVGVQLRAGLSRLSPLRTDQSPYTSLSNAVLGRWNHDFTVRWNGFASAGIEQVFTDIGSRPLAFLPSGSAILRYAGEGAVGSLEFTHGTATNLAVGAVSLTDLLTARGIVTIDAFKSRALSFSAGFLHNEPIGEAAAAVAAATGNAVQGDGAFTTALTRRVLASLRYSVAYQFGQGGGVGPTLAHIFFLGVTGSVSNTNLVQRPFPKLGQRVDGGDSQGFPVVPQEEPGQDTSHSP
ncbi:MAG TPA: hypothetical protein VHN14_03140 [Kofleriaceae bacterium]|nr:hypothetical protein [Kofleriaceae bacterium]